jgi:hypothetical protein
MSDSQRIMLFRLFNDACRVQGWKPCDDVRHTITEQVLGQSKSWTELNNRDVDALKAKFQFLISPDDFNLAMASNDGENKERRRLIYSINKMGASLGGDYIRHIASNKFDVKKWEALSLWKLKQLHMTIVNRHRKHISERRKEPVTAATSIDGENPF